MKYSIVAASALVTMALAKPAFTNLAFDIVEGEPFTLSYSGCDSGCTILLQQGQEGQPPVQELTTSASGDSFTITLSDLPSGDYYFRIINNESNEDNYSDTFPYQGTGEASSTTSVATSSAAETSTSAEATTSESSSTRSTSSAVTTVTTVTSSASTSASTTESASSTESDEPSSTSDSAPSSTTTPPDDAAGSLGSPLTLVLGVAAAVALL
jgi:hypothetical protein